MKKNLILILAFSLFSFHSLAQTFQVGVTNNTPDDIFVGVQTTSSDVSCGPEVDLPVQCIAPGDTEVFNLDIFHPFIYRIGCFEVNTPCDFSTAIPGTNHEWFSPTHSGLACGTDVTPTYNINWIGGLAGSLLSHVKVEINP